MNTNVSVIEKNVIIEDTIVSHRRSYHTNIKILAKCDLLPKEVKAQIPKSNISRWQNEDLSDIFGSEFCKIIDENAKLLQGLFNHKKLLKVCLSVLRIKNAIIENTKNKISRCKKMTKEAKKLIIRTIDRVKDTLSLERALHYFKITINQYYQWANQIKTECLETLIDLCPRIYPNQLCKSEIKKMKEILSDIKHKGWSIFSLCWHCIKNGILYVSVGSWYKYSKILGFQRRLPESRKNYPVGIRAEKPLQKIHADVTIFRPLDNTKVYIYIIMDNRSRFIFSWRTARESSGKICAENLQKTYIKYLQSSISDIKPVEFIVDGGSENNNADVDKFLEEIKGAIQKLIAQKDIIFSNSIVESVNKTLKYRHLFQQDLPDFESTVRYLEKAIPEYNNRPHSKLGGLSPQEVLSGVILDKEAIKNGFTQSYQARIEENRKVRCKNCSASADIIENPAIVSSN